MPHLVHTVDAADESDKYTIVTLMMEILTLFWKTLDDKHHG